MLQVALIQNVFTCVLPLPKPSGASDEASCIWRTTMLYDQQLGVMLLLQRLMEHFAASVLSLDTTPPHYNDPAPPSPQSNLTPPSPDLTPPHPTCCRCSRSITRSCRSRINFSSFLLS